MKPLGPRERAAPPHRRRARLSARCAWRPRARRSRTRSPWPQSAASTPFPARHDSSAFLLIAVKAGILTAQCGMSSSLWCLLVGVACKNACVDHDPQTMHNPCTCPHACQHTHMICLARQPCHAQHQRPSTCADSGSGLTLTNISVLPLPPRHGCKPRALLRPCAHYALHWTEARVYRCRPGTAAHTGPQSLACFQAEGTAAAALTRWQS